MKLMLSVLLSLKLCIYNLLSALLLLLRYTEFELPP
jgi:hypothetical protein